LRDAQRVPGFRDVRPAHIAAPWAVFGLCFQHEQTTATQPVPPFDLDQPIVGDDHAIGIAGQIADDLFAGRARFHPLGPPHMPMPHLPVDVLFFVPKAQP